MEPIQTERLTLRLVQPEDWRSVQKIWQDAAASEFGQYDNFKDTANEAVKPRIARWAELSPGAEHVFFAACLENRMIGYISFNAREDGYEVGYNFCAESHGHGYGREAVSAVLEAMRVYHPRKYTVGTALANTPSVKMLESLGFRLTGTEQVSFYRDADGNPIYFEGGIYEL